MDAHSFVEEMSRDMEDASEVLGDCDPDEQVSLKYCVTQMNLILVKATRNLRDFQRGIPTSRACH